MAVMSLSVDPSKGIVSFLDGLRDIRRIKLMFPGIQNTFQTHTETSYLLHRNFSKRISTFGLCPQELSRILFLTGTIIGGSLPLQCVTGEFYDYNNSSDIDLYIHNSGRPIILGYIMSRGYVVEKMQRDNSGRIHGNWCSHEYDVAIGDEYMAISSGISLFHHKTGQKIDCLIMKWDRYPRDAIYNYDFSFLRNFYDGKKFHLSKANDILMQRGSYNQVCTSQEI